MDRAGEDAIEIIGPYRGHQWPKVAVVFALNRDGRGRAFVTIGCLI